MKNEKNKKIIFSISGAAIIIFENYQIFVQIKFRNDRNHFENLKSFINRFEFFCYAWRPLNRQ